MTTHDLICPPLLWAQAMHSRPPRSTGTRASAEMARLVMPTPCRAADDRPVAETGDWSDCDCSGAGPGLAT